MDNYSKSKIEKDISANQVKSDSAKDIWQKDKDHHLHPWHVFDSFDKEGALVIAKGDGCYIYDTDGKRYLDAVGGLWCNNIGLGRTDMADAIAEQVIRMSYASAFVDMGNIPAAELAAKVAQLAPGSLNHVFFTTGGSTAIDTTFRLIQFYQSCLGKENKKHIIALKGSYHGSTYAAMSIGGKKADHIPEFHYITDFIHHISCPNYYRAQEGLTESEFLESLIQEFEEKILTIQPVNVAAFFAEPIMGAGGVIVPPKGYHKRIWDLCKKYDILYVSDEVVTAFGRLGEWFVSEELFGIQPDIITSAKGISSGYLPLGASIFSDEIWEVISAPNPERFFANGYTYSGHPVCAAAALKNIEILETENILENVKDVGLYFEQQLNTLRDLPIVGDVRGSYLMMCVEFVSNQETKKCFPDEVDIGKRISNHADSLGLIVRPIGHLNVMSPPLIMTREQVDFTVTTLRKSIEIVLDDLPIT
jgi:putrescine---pyruvate transaminase